MPSENVWVNSAVSKKKSRGSTGRFSLMDVGMRLADLLVGLVILTWEARHPISTEQRESLSGSEFIPQCF